MKPLVIALYGYPLSGKDTIANYFIHRMNLELWKVAFPIKQVAATLFDWEYDIFEDRDRKEVVDPRWGISPRQAAQFIGYDMVIALGEKFPLFKETTGNLLFGRILEESIRKEISDPDFAFLNGIIVSDIRFPAEYGRLEAMKASGEIDLILIRVNRTGTAPANNHVSESHYDSFRADHIVNNDGTLEDLEDQMDILIRKIYDGREV